MFKEQPLSFKLKSGEFKATLISSPESSRQLAIVLPGAGYGPKAPLLYFATEVLLKKKFEVLTIDTVYGDFPKWRALATAEAAMKVVADDAPVLFKEIEKKFSTQIHTVVARSLGTYSTACAIEQGAVKPEQIVWQTPSLRDKWAVINGCGIRGFGIIGTADERYESAKPFMPRETLVVENADHGMEIPGDPIQTIEILKRVTAATLEWL